MNERFAAVVESLHPSFEALRSARPLKFKELPTTMPLSGVYMFSEGERHLYVGRSNKLRERYHWHCRPGSQQNQASFAFKLAREAIGFRDAYPPGIFTRKALALWPACAVAFAEAKARIRAMEYRYVEERDQTRQALLEAYCTIALDTPYNDFNTH